MKYIKINPFLQFPLFRFSRYEVFPISWDYLGIEQSVDCTINLAPFEHDVYTALMSLWYNGFHEVTTTDIANTLQINKRHWRGRIKLALEKLQQCIFTFTNCLQHPKLAGIAAVVKTTLINLEKIGESRWTKYIISMPDVVQKYIDAGLFQLLDLKEYLKMPTGLPRRLWEFLEKKKNQTNGEFEIREAILSRWLPVTAKRIYDRWKTVYKNLEKLKDAGYGQNKSEMIVKWEYNQEEEQETAERAKDVFESAAVEEEIKPIVIEPVAETEPVVVQTHGSNGNGAQRSVQLDSMERITSSNYHGSPDGYFQLPPDHSAFQQPSRPPQQQTVIFPPNQANGYQVRPQYQYPQQPQPEPDTPELIELFELVTDSEKGDSINALLRKYYREKGYEYCKRKVHYANASKPGDNYGAVLGGALKNNGGVDWWEKHERTFRINEEIERLCEEMFDSWSNNQMKHLSDHFKKYSSLRATLPKDLIRFINQDFGKQFNLDRCYYHQRLGDKLYSIAERRVEKWRQQQQEKHRQPVLQN